MKGTSVELGLEGVPLRARARPSTAGCERGAGGGGGEAMARGCRVSVMVLGAVWVLGLGAHLLLASSLLLVMQR